MQELNVAAEIDGILSSLGRLLVDAGLEVEVGVTDDDRLLSLTLIGDGGGPEPVRRTIGHVPGRIIRSVWSEDRPRDHQEPTGDSHER